MFNLFIFDINKYIYIYKFIDEIQLLKTLQK